MSNIIEDAGSVLGVLGNVLIKGTWEGIKIGYQTGKITGKIVKETTKGAVERVKAIIKTVTDK